MPFRQLSLDLPNSHSVSPQVQAAIEQLACNPQADARGAIFTRQEVVEFILDLVGYREEQPLHTMRLLEPSFGRGDFLLAIIKRLLKAWRAFQSNGVALDDLSNAIRAVELHHTSFKHTTAAVINLLKSDGLDSKTATTLSNRWLSQGDFLLTPLDGEFEVVVGNPPYIRPELIPAPLLAAYRNRYRTMFDRADIYTIF